MPVVGLGDFGQIIVGDSLAILVKRDLTGGSVKREMRQRVAKLGLIAGAIAVLLVECREQRFRFDVIALREQRRRREAVFVRGFIVVDEFLPRSEERRV